MYMLTRATAPERVSNPQTKPKSIFETIGAFLPFHPRRKPAPAQLPVSEESSQPKDQVLMQKVQQSMDGFLTTPPVSGRVEKAAIIMPGTLDTYLIRPTPSPPVNATTLPRPTSRVQSVSARFQEKAATSRAGTLDRYLVPKAPPPHMTAFDESPATLEVFHRFRDMPPELRIKIWKIMSFTQRNIDIQNKEFYMSDDFEMGEPDFVPHMLFTTRPPPAILHTCRESRSEGLKYYTLEFGTTLSRRLCTVTTPPKIYFNWDVDRLCLMSPGSLDECYSELDTSLNRKDELLNIIADKGLKYLAVNVACSDEVSSYLESGHLHEYPIYCELLPKRGDLKELIMFEDDRWTHWGTHELSEPVIFKRVNGYTDKHVGLLRARQDVRIYFCHSPPGVFDEETVKWYKALKLKLRRT